MSDTLASRKFGTMQAILTRNGVRGVAFVALQKVLPPRWASAEWYHLYETRQAVPSDLRAAWARSYEDIAALSASSGQDANPGRLRDGHRVAVAYDGDVPVSYLWVHGGSEYTEEGVTFVLAPDEYWIFDGFTLPSHRGRRFYPRLVHWAVRDLAPRRILSTIDVVNHGSVRAAAARGAVRLTTLFALRVGPFLALRMDGRWRVGRHPFRLTAPG